MTIYNPSLRQEPRYEPAAVLPVTRDTSLLDWLQETHRLIPREKEDPQLEPLNDDVEISELMDVDDHLYDDVEDDLDLSDED
ncbi:MAG: DUF3134 domain-containing protein [Woronichinia naegeliana WA131]|jgi:hypothetical protein|uniref:DUF3134 domain-containing protein n=1 Tax=Woronichinia naegeliana WA131 TaxID=2824559 RepID=A0A977KVM0_9CYAN|nr:MAG: DUF3134 domain-containing protein [Woronichinia naegeliana WA131]